MRPLKPRTAFILGGLAALAAAGLGGVLYTQSGWFDVSASKPHTFLTFWIVNHTMIHSEKVRSKGIEAPARFTPAQVAAGFCEYERHCVACHGAPAVARAPWVEGLNPTPPYLIDAPRRWKRAELFHIVHNGVKMTAMPAWQYRLSDAQVWDVVAFVEAVPKMPPQSYLRWRAARPCGAADAGPAVPGR